MCSQNCKEARVAGRESHRKGGQQSKKRPHDSHWSAMGPPWGKSRGVSSSDVSTHSGCHIDWRDQGRSKKTHQRLFRNTSGRWWWNRVVVVAVVKNGQVLETF